MLAWACAGALGGLGAAHVFACAIPIWAAMIAGLVLLWLITRRTYAAVLPLVLLAGVCGVWRGEGVQAELDNYQGLVLQEVVAEGRVSEDAVYDDKGRRDFRIDTLRLDGRELPGQLRVRTFAPADVRRGDTVRATGKLYPGFGNYQATMPYAQVSTITKQASPIESLRRAFFAGTYNALPEPQASLGLGFVVGLKSQLPDDLSDQLRALALTHIVVASGFNLTILIRVSRRLLAKRSLFQAFAGSLALMLGMLAITGMSPSMFRASVVTSLALAAWYWGRTVHPALLLLLGALITAWWNPLQLWFDLGWWLSFAAFAGVLLLAPMLQRRFVARDKPPLLVQVLIETVSAQLLAEPIIMLMFGQLSVLGLVANVLIVPLIPLTMLATVIAGIAGIVWPGMAGWLALPAKFALDYILWVVQGLGSLPWALQKVAIGWWGLAGLYGAVALFGLVLYRKTRMRFRQARAIIE